MKFSKLLNNLAYVLDSDLVRILYKIRLNGNLEYNERKKFCELTGRRLYYEILKYADNEDKSIINSRLSAEWEKYLTVNEKPIGHLICRLFLADIKYIEKAYADFTEKKSKPVASMPISEFISKLAVEKTDKIYFPCNSAKEFLESSLNILGDKSEKIYGQVNSWLKMDEFTKYMKEENINCDFGQVPADILVNDRFAKEKFDYILANPPFNFSGLPDCINFSKDYRMNYGIPPKTNTNFVWLQHILFHLNETGRAAVIMPNSTLTSMAKQEYIIRRNILCDNKVEAIITFPKKLFKTTEVAFCIWLLKNNCSSTLFIDASRIMKSKNEDGFQKVSELVGKFREGTLKKRGSVHAITTIDKIAENDYILSPNLYLESDYKIDIKQNKNQLDLLVDKVIMANISSNLNNALNSYKYLNKHMLWTSEMLYDLYNVSVGINIHKNLPIKVKGKLKKIKKILAR